MPTVARLLEPATASSASLSFFLRSRSLFSLCNGVKMAFWSEETGITMYLELFPTFPRILFLLELKFLPLLFLLQWSQNHDPLERTGVATHLKFFLAFPCLLFLFTFKFLSPPFLLQWGWSDAPSEGLGLHTPQAFPGAPSFPSHAQVPFAFVLWPPFRFFRVHAPFASCPSAMESEICSIGSSGIHNAPRALPPVP